MNVSIEQARQNLCFLRIKQPVNNDEKMFSNLTAERWIIVYVLMERSRLFTFRSVAVELFQKSEDLLYKVPFTDSYSGLEKRDSRLNYWNFFKKLTR